MTTAKKHDRGSLEDSSVLSDQMVLIGTTLMFFFSAL